MRARKLDRMRKGLAQIDWKVITFNNDDFSHYLTEASPPLRWGLRMDVITRDIQTLKYAAAAANATSLCSCQIGSETNAFVLFKNAYNNTMRKWVVDGDPTETDYDCFLAPKMMKGSELVDSTEESFSFPFFKFNTRRYSKIEVIYRKDDRSKMRSAVHGFAARAFQQNIDQLNGICPLNWRVNHGRMWISEEVIEHFPKANAVLEQYTKNLAKTFKDYPQILDMPEVYDANASKRNSVQEQAISYEQDFMKRISRHYTREFTLLTERIKSGLITVKPN